MSTLADLFTSEHPNAAARFDALCLEFAVRLVPDHEGALLRGCFIQRRPVPPSRYLELARSWEQFDRAFAPAEESETTFALGQLERFLKRACIAGDLGDHVLFVIERDNAPDVLVSLGDDAWDDWLTSIQRERADGEVAAVRLREHLQRGLRPGGLAQGRDLSGR